MRTTMPHLVDLPAAAAEEVASYSHTWAVMPLHSCALCRSPSRQACIPRQRIVKVLDIQPAGWRSNYFVAHGQVARWLLRDAPSPADCATVFPTPEGCEWPAVRAACIPAVEALPGPIGLLPRAPR
jgi:hypothetical protein